MGSNPSQLTKLPHECRNIGISHCLVVLDLAGLFRQKMIQVVGQPRRIVSEAVALPPAPVQYRLDALAQPRSNYRFDIQIPSRP